MNKYNIRVGDYVETLNGGIGYVTNATSNDFMFDIEIDGRKIKHKTGQYCWYPYCLIDIENVFKRIGANDFSKKENKFKPIESLDGVCVPTYELLLKTNELIDHINAIQERLNEYDSARTN